MPLSIHDPGRRDTEAYKRFRREVKAERPICEHCNTRKTAVVAHKVQPLFGGGLMDRGNVLGLCIQCDRAFTRSNPPLRRRKQRKV